MNVIPIDQDESKYIGRTDVPEKFVKEGKPSYETWLTRELPAEGKMRTGLWTGEPGTLTMRKYPPDEVCTLRYGKIEIPNEALFKVGQLLAYAMAVNLFFVGIWEMPERYRELVVVDTEALPAP